MSEFAENQTQEHDVDAIIDKAYNHEPSIVDSKPEPTQAPSTPAPQEPQYKEFEFNARGQPIKIKENDPRLTQWLSQGYDYAQSMQAFKEQSENFNRQKQEWEKSYTPYKEIDEFAKQNPEWWQTVEQSYQQRLSTQQVVPDQIKQYIDQHLKPVSQDIPLMKQFLQEMQTQKMEKQQKEEDARLENSIKSIRDKYPHLDFSAKDQTGLSLEKRVIDHALKNGIPTFEAAFAHYYGDTLISQAEARGREAVMADMKKRAKLGLLDESTPTPGEASYPRQPSGPKSWNDLRGEDILREFKF